MSTTPPGWYHAAGDPAGTVRWWDGTEWSPEPVPPPPGWTDPHAPLTDRRFARAWIRIWASIIDALIAIVVLLPFLFDYISDVIDDIDAGGDGQSVPIPVETIFVGLVTTGVYLLMVAFLGGTPGKLMTGLRITRADGSTTPVGLGPAALRALPGFIGVIPVLGPLVGTLFPVVALIMVLADQAERRSASDRIAKTRVVYKRELDRHR